MCARGMLCNRMIPKSGYRFSDKIMRKRRSTTSPSTIASRLNRRWDRLSARSCSASVARIEQREIRDGPFQAFRSSPGFVSLNPGYKQTIKGSGTPVDADPYPPHPAVRLAPCKARSPAGVPLAALAKGTFVPKAQRQAMLPGTRPERTIL